MFFMNFRFRLSGDHEPWSWSCSLSRTVHETEFICEKNCLFKKKNYKMVILYFGFSFLWFFSVPGTKRPTSPVPDETKNVGNIQSTNVVLIWLVTEYLWKYHAAKSDLDSSAIAPSLSDSPPDTLLMLLASHHCQTWRKEEEEKKTKRIRRYESCALVISTESFKERLSNYWCLWLGLI